MQDRRSFWQGSTARTLSFVLPESVYQALNCRQGHGVLGVVIPERACKALDAGKDLL